MGTKWGALPRGVTVREHKSGKQTIQVAFTYKGVRCREPLDIPVTKRNINYAGNLIGEIKNAIERDTFKYADYFPKSKKLMIFGHQVDKGKTVGEYLEDYQESAIKRGLSPSTIEGYRKLKLSLSELHKTPIVELTAARLKAFIRDSKNSTKTLRNKFSYLRSALAEAVTDGLVEINPVDTIKLSNYVRKDNKVSLEGVHDDVDPFTPKEVEAILTECKPDEINIVQLGFSCGLRPSEWSALRWSDINFDKKELTVSIAIVHHTKKGPKTKAGKRKVPLDSQAIIALKQQRLLSKNIDGFVFTKTRSTRVQFPNGELNRINPDSFRKHRWGKILERAKVRYRYPYQMRHTFATRHISQGENLWKLANWMGHSSPEMLFRHYGSYIEEYEKQSQNDTPMTRKSDMN